MNLGAWVGGGFNNQTGPILVHIYPLFILIYMPNIEAIYDKNLLNFKIKIKNKFFSGPCIKSRGIRGTEMSANAALITMETYVQ